MLNAESIGCASNCTSRMLGPIYLPIQQPKPPQVVRSYAEGVTIHAAQWVGNAQNNTVEYSGNVEVLYGPTRVTADRLIYHIDPKDPYGEAIGNVRLTDPEGTITASDLTFHTITHVGSGHNIAVQVSMLRLTAESIEITPDLWTLRNVGGTGCQLKTPLYYIHTQELRIRPDQGVKAIKPQFSILGHKLFTLPAYSFSFNGEGSAIHFPYPTYRSERGFGIDWTTAMTLDSETTLFTKYAVFQRSLPFYNATLLRSAVRGRDPEPLRSEIGERYPFGYFDNVQVRTHAAEELYLTSNRFDFGLSSTFGSDVGGTTTPGNKIDKPIEVLAQASGKAGGFGVFGLMRAQDVKLGNGPETKRVLFEGNLLSPRLPLADKLSLVGRIDAAEYFGGNSYGWLHGQAGLLFEPTANIHLGVSYGATRDHGIPDFPFDAPLRFHEINLRTDFDFDTTQLRLLLKYDPSRRETFDREVYFSQVLGCIEPYVVYRERPHKFFIGIKLPLSRVFEKLSKTELERRAAIRNAISGTVSGNP